MSILSHQNILLGSQPGNGGQSSFAKYSFGPSMSKRGSPESTEVGKFLYNSPTRSYTRKAIMQTPLGQGNLGEGAGVDGKNIRKGTYDTTYGPTVGADGIVSKMSNSDSSLLTGIANVLSGKLADPDYHAIDYFTTRTPKATRSYHSSENLGGNNGGSGVERKYFTASRKYPAQILTTGEGAEYVPTLPLEHQGTGLFNLIPKTPGSGNEGTSSDNYEQTNNADTIDQMADNQGDGNTTDSTTKVHPGDVMIETTALDPSSDDYWERWAQSLSM